MPLLSEAEQERLFAEDDNVFCSSCTNRIRRNYCRTCDQFFRDGHASDCPEVLSNEPWSDNHAAHRTYQLPNPPPSGVPRGTPFSQALFISVENPVATVTGAQIEAAIARGAADAAAVVRTQFRWNGLPPWERRHGRREPEPAPPAAAPPAPPPQEEQPFDPDRIVC